MPAQLRPIRPIRLVRPAALALSASAIALTLAGCKVDSRPLLARGETGYATSAAYAYDPDALGLPYAQPARLAPVDDYYDGYAIAERAYAYDRAAYRAPPDYGFRYGDADPWAWQLANDSLMFAEPYGDDYRFYYYEPGEAYPYFVRDDRYGYAYGENGALMALFSAAGALLPNSELGSVADIAGRYLARGYDLRDTYYDSPRYAVAEPLWIERAPLIYAAQEPWILAAEQVPVWRQYRVSTGERELRAFQAERLRREALAARFDDRIDWDSAKAVRKAVKEERKIARDIAKDERKFVREIAREDRKALREEAKDRRKWEREQARDAFDAGRPAAVVVRERGDDRRKFERHDDHRTAGDDHRGRGHDVQPRQVAQAERHDDGHRGRGGDDHKDRGGDHGKGHGGDHGKKDGDGGKGRGGKD